MSTERDPLELLADEFVQRYRRGERPSVTQYAEQHPHLADDILDLFPTILAVEYARVSYVSGNQTKPVDWENVPARLGDFRIIRELGRGGMGIVYEAEQESLQRIVALKVLPRALTDQEQRRERFQREARTAARLHHTNIVPVFGVGSHEGHDYFVMQRIRGAGLDELISALARQNSERNGAHSRFDTTDLVALAKQLVNQPGTAAGEETRSNFHNISGPDLDESSNATSLSQTSLEVASSNPTPLSNGEHRCSTYWRMVARLIAQAAGALAYAHGQGVQHRDVKPGNLILDEEGLLWITDFGLAKAIEHDNLTQAGDVLGTLRYMAPEQFNGTFDERSDQYSLGITIYEIATLRPAFAQVQRSELVNAIMSSSITPPRQFLPAIPRDLETIILKATANDPRQRYADMGDFQSDLEDFVADRPIRARRMSIMERGTRWVRRHRALSAALGLMVGLIATVAVVSTTAYFKVSAANKVTSTALDDARAQRERAESTAQLAVEALDTIFGQFAPVDELVSGELTTDETDSVTISVTTPPVISTQSAQLLASMLEFYQRLAAQEGGVPELQRKTATALARVGLIHEQLGQLNQARDAYANALSRYEALSEPDESHDRLAEAKLHNQIGRIHQLQDAPNEASTNFEQALTLLESSDEKRSFEQELELARTYYMMSRRPGELANPERRKPREPRDRPRRDGPPPDGPHGEGPRRDGPRHDGPHHDRPPRDAPPPDRRGGPERHRRHDQVERSDSVERAIEILERLSQQNEQHAQVQHLLARCLAAKRPRPGRRFRPPSDDHIVRATEIMEALVVRSPKNLQYRVDLAELLSRRHTERDAPKRVQRAEGMIEELVTKQPNVPAYSFLLAQIKLRCGHIARRNEDDKTARTAFAEALSVQQELAKRFPDIASYAIAVAFYELEYGRFLRENDDLKQAELILRAALKRIDGPDNRPMKRDQRDLASRCYREIATLYRTEGRHRLAAEADRKARSLRSPPGDHPSPRR